MSDPAIDVFALPVLAAADVFPLMSDEELQELAADIKENGLHEPLVIADVQTNDGEIVVVLVDGRNRRAACKIVGVEPQIRKLNGEDPNAYVLSANIHRRHMTKGQRAMAVAMIYPEPKRGRGHRDPAKDTETVSFTRINQARIILSYSRPLADSVLAGIKPLDAAYKEAQAAKQAQMGESARMERLRAEASDLADLVTEERMSLSEAIAANDKRQSERAERIKQANDAAARLWRDISNCLGCIAHGSELGWRYVLPEDDRGFAESLMQRLGELLKGPPQ